MRKDTFYKIREDGFTLIEVLVAVTILAVGMLAMAGVTTSIINANRLTFETTDAIHLAQLRIETIAATMSFDAGDDGIIGAGDDPAASDGPDATNGTDDDIPASAGLLDLDSPGFIDNGPDAAPGTVDDVYDITTDVSSYPAVFSSPDCVPATQNACAANQTVTISATPQVVYNIRDNFPINGVKTITVIVGWQEQGDRYVTMQMMMTSSAITNRF